MAKGVNGLRNNRAKKFPRKNTRTSTPDLSRRYWESSPDSKVGRVMGELIPSEENELNFGWGGGEKKGRS